MADRVSDERIRKALDPTSAVSPTMGLTVAKGILWISEASQPFLDIE